MHVPEQTGRPIGGGNGTIAYHGVAFVFPFQPAVSVQVDVYTDSGPSTSPVFELLVIYIVPAKTRRRKSTQRYSKRENRLSSEYRQWNSENLYT